MREADFPSLSLLFGGYFHPDWQMDRSTPGDNVRWFIEREPSGSVSDARSELDMVLAAQLSDEELRQFVVGTLGSYYDPTLVGIPMRVWLKEVRATLADKG